jgi:signal recognition particle subunit SRP54
MADVLLVDTAGRLAIDEAMMAEIKDLHRALIPIETLFVVDAMTGQDAANTAKAFARPCHLTGVVLTKTDGDARGGAALSVRYITGRPIKFLGVGEKPDGARALPPRPHRLAHPRHGRCAVAGRGGRPARSTRTRSRSSAKKVVAGKKFDLEDMRDQLTQMQTMGGLSAR